MEKHLKSIADNLNELLSVLKDKEGSSGFEDFHKSFTDLVKKLKDEDSPSRQNLIFEEDTKKFLKIKEFNEAQVLTRKIALYPVAKAYSYHLYKFIKQEDRFKILKQKNYYTYQNGVAQEEWDDFQVGVDELEEIPWEVTFFVEDTVLGFRFVLRFLFDDEKYCFYHIKGDKKKILKLNNEFKDYFNKHNVYRNKRVDYGPRGLEFLPESTTTFEDVVLDPAIRNEIDENILNIFENAKLYKKHGIPLKRGVIFSGPPGCGKSLTVNALTNYFHNKITVINVTPKSVGTPGDISNIYEFARMLSPSLVIFEDIDLLGGDRAKGEFSPYVGELLSQLDGLIPNKQIVTIASTNFPERLDEALRNRPSRFDRNLTFAAPTGEIRIRFLKKYLAEHKLSKDINFDIISKKLEDLSGAQIREVVISSVLYALGQRGKKNKEIILTTDDLLAGIDKSKNKFKPTRENKKVGFHS